MNNKVRIERKFKETVWNSKEAAAAVLQGANKEFIAVCRKYGLSRMTVVASALYGEERKEHVGVTFVCSPNSIDRNFRQIEKAVEHVKTALKRMSDDN